MIKNTHIILLLVVSVYSVTSAQVAETYSSLEIGYGLSEDLPTNVVLGVNGQVYIKDNSSTTTRVINDTYLDSFMLWVEKGVVSEDLAIGSKNIWLADYVFETDYKLPSLKETQAYIKQHKHLPSVIGQNKLDKQGFYRVNEMLIGQLKNLEELVLHTIAQEKEIEKQTKENQELNAWAAKLEKRLNTLENE